MRRRFIRRILFILGLLTLVVLIGTSGFMIIEGYSWFDAFYLTLSTITTIGYPEPRPLSHGGQVFNSFLIIFGVSAVFVAVGAMTQTIIEIELQGLFRRAQEEENDPTTARSLHRLRLRPRRTQRLSRIPANRRALSRHRPQS